MHLVLDARALPHHLRAAHDLAAQPTRALVGQPHRWQEIRREQLRQDPRVHLVLTLASAIARVFSGFDTTTRATRGASSATIASLLPVASNATSSSGRSVCAHARNRSGRHSTRPASVTIAFSSTADLREVPMHIQPNRPCHHGPPSSLIRRTGTAGRTTPTDSRSQRSRTSRRGGQLLTRARSPSCKNGLPMLVPNDAPVPDGRTVRPAPGGLASRTNNARRHRLPAPFACSSTWPRAHVLGPESMLLQGRTTHPVALAAVETSDEM